MGNSPSSPNGGLMSPSDMSSLALGHPHVQGKQLSHLPFIALISEQEQEVAANMLMYFKASIDGLLATIVHLRSENQNFQKENMTLTMLNGALQSDYEFHKGQLIKFTQLMQQQQDLVQMSGQVMTLPDMHPSQQELLQSQQQNQARQLLQEQQQDPQVQLLKHEQQQHLLQQQQEQAHMHQQAHSDQLQHMNFASHYGGNVVADGGYTHQSNMVEIDGATKHASH